MGPEVVWDSQVKKNPGDAVVAWENKQLSRQLKRKTPVGRQASGERMNADDCNGRSYAPGSGGESSTEQDFYGGLRGPSVRSPNSQQSSPHRSLSANSIKVELCSDDESPGAPQPEKREAVREDSRREDRGDTKDEGSAEHGGAGGERGSIYNELASSKPASPIRLPNGKLQCDVCGMICIGPNVLMVHKRSHTGERPFQCNQCGASFTQKGNLLRHIKLHSGEKPFKCPICNYACRRRDALAGHLRTHTASSPTVGKPFKCSYCSRSYKQKNTLEEHLERCHSYLKSLDHQTAISTQPAQGEESARLEPMTKPMLQPATEKLPFVDRLVNSITKRKRSTPQKFLGEKHMRLNLPEAPYELSSGSEKEGDLMSSQPARDSAALVGLGGKHLQAARGKGENHEPPKLSQLHPAFLSELRSVNSHVAPQGPRAHGGGGLAAMCLGLAGREAGEGRDDPASAHSHTTSPNGCPDSTDTESTAEEQSTGVAAPTSTSNHHHLHHRHYPTPALPRSHPTSSPGQAKDSDPEWERACPVPPAVVKRSTGSPLSSRGTVQVVDREDRPVRSFPCPHCRIIFLDYVMFTIHMGCHGFRQPFECNICGHRSQDRYEFSSHISRGEHQVG
ncbi:zinc finger protein Eos [Centroberyx gerrardi]|uniref:zinc finger protein Eos n=1 Tax=Centroberyx gerrardi TaxID=166262 RepID=UPI003AAAA12A